MAADQWGDEELERFGGSDEVGISSRRTDGTLRPYVTIWLVRAGTDLYVRSAYGTGNPWFRRALAAGTGAVRAGDAERDVVFEAVAAGDPALDAVTAAYHAKYDRYGQKIVGTVTGADADVTTLRLHPAA
jgi:hypothetical protein